LRIIIDAGHGGEDPGAVGEYSQEKDITLRISNVLNALLQIEGFKTKMTREKDCKPSWEDRVESTEEDIFVSIHCNAVEQRDIQGIETYHYKTSKAGKKLAELAQDNLINSTNRLDRGAKGSKELYVLRKTKCPAILVESGFISNLEEEQLLNTLNLQAKVAVSIAQAIKEYSNGSNG
jgi:N-acetylmuramoyl-L-alanine amidase